MEPQLHEAAEDPNSSCCRELGLFRRFGSNLLSWFNHEVS